MEAAIQPMSPDPGIVREFQMVDPRLDVEWAPQVRALVLFRHSGPRRHDRSESRHFIELFRWPDGTPRQPSMVDVERIREFDCGARGRQHRDIERDNEEATRKSREYVRAEAHLQRLEAARRGAKLRETENTGFRSHIFDVGRKGPR